MNEISLFKLISGEEIIAKVSNEDVDTIKIVDAVTLVYQQAGEGRMTVGFAPFMPYADDKATIGLNKASITSTATPKEQILSEYNRIFSNIVIAPANSIF